MKTTDIVKLSLNSLTHRQLRSWLTILGIIIGVAAVVAMLSIGAGMSQSVESQMSNFGADILTVSAGYTRAAGAAGGFADMPQGPGGGGRMMMDMRTMEEDNSDEPTLTDTDLYAILGADGVEAVCGEIDVGRVEIDYLSESVSVSAEGIDPTTWSDMTTSTVDSGRFLNAGESNSVVVGYSIAHEMFEHELEVGTQIKIESKTYKIVGILSQSGTGSFGGDDRTVFMTFDAARTLADNLDSNEYSSIEVQISDTNYVDQIIENVENVLYSSRFVTEDTKDFTVTSPTSMLETITSTMETLSFFLIGIASISLLVGAIGIANTMFMSVMERTRLIGILKSLGTKNSEVMTLFVTESGIIGLMGGLLGIFLGLILVGFISSAGLTFMGMGRQMGTTTSVAVVTPELILFALFFSTVIGIVSGLIPARKAAKLEIVEAMRSE
jgi:putative ABC transport system permease protein